MAIDFQTKSPGDNVAFERPSPPAGNRGTSALGKWLKRGIGVLILASLLAAGGLSLLRSFESEDAGDLLTHSIARGNLVVSVSEEGALESANNDEIKCLVKGGGTIVWIIESGETVEPGDLLVRFDTSVIDENISQQKIAYENARATLVQSQSDLAVAEIALTEYREGTYQSALKLAQSNVALAEANLVTAQNILEHSQKMFRLGYQSELDVQTNSISMEQARLQLEVYEADLDALERFTRAKMVEELGAAVRAAEAKVASDQATLDLEQARLSREELQLENCEIYAETAGMVLYAKGRDWEDTPSIDVGEVIPEQRTMLIIPDLSRMQVSIDVHESKIDLITKGMPAQIELQGAALILDGEVESIATVTSPAGWWNGNEVAYDTIIAFESRDAGLKPGMSAEVKVYIARHENILRIPVAAVAQLDQQFYCWVQGDDGTERRTLDLGDSNDQYIVVNGGLSEGEEVVLNPDRFIDEAREGGLRPVDEAGPTTSGDEGLASRD